MIRLEQPSLCLNSHDVPGPNYKMWQTKVVPEGTSPVGVVGMIIGADAVAKSAGRHGLRNIVINCHGFPGGISPSGSGKAGFNRNNVSLFNVLKPLNVGPIWLVACRAALGTAGLAFCSNLARAASTLVVASEDYQAVTAVQTVRYYTSVSDQIDDYEGAVHLFFADGGVEREIDPERRLHTVMV